jgi:hypothetical protein
MEHALQNDAKRIIDWVDTKEAELEQGFHSACGAIAMNKHAKLLCKDLGRLDPRNQLMEAGNDICSRIKSRLNNVGESDGCRQCECASCAGSGREALTSDTQPLLEITDQTITERMDETTKQMIDAHAAGSKKEITRLQKLLEDQQELLEEEQAKRKKAEEEAVRAFNRSQNLQAAPFHAAAVPPPKKPKKPVSSEASKDQQALLDQIAMLKKQLAAAGKAPDTLVQSEAERERERGRERESEAERERERESHLLLKMMMHDCLFLPKLCLLCGL